MPRLPELKLEPFRDLLAQQRFSPRAALLADIERAAALAGDIDPEGMYDERWIVERVTGHRVTLDEPSLLAGSAVLADLSALVEHFCQAASLSEADLPGEALTVERASEELGVSRRTLERYRREGLIARRAKDERGRARVLIPRAALDAFRDRQPERLASAKAFSRPDEAEVQRMCALARGHAEAGMRFAQVCKAVAGETGRSHNAVRRVLLQASGDRGASGEGQRNDPARLPDFTPAWQRTDDRDRARIARAMAWGVPPRRVAERYRRAAATVNRIWLTARASALLEIARSLPSPEPGETIAPGTIALAVPPVDPPSDTRAFVACCAELPPPGAARERELLAAHRALLLRAGARTRELRPARASATDIDAAETDLRHALRLREALVMAEWPLLLRTIESRLGSPLVALSPVDAPRVLAAALAAAHEALAQAPAPRGGRLAARLSMALARRLATADAQAEPGRASSSASLPAHLFEAAPWSARMKPHPRLVGALSVLGEDDRAIISRRFGFGLAGDGDDAWRPMTVAETARCAGVTPQRVVAAWRRARGAVRRADSR